MLKKILDFYTKYFAIFVIVFGIIAYIFPKPFVFLKPGMDWFFALTMFGIGMVLTRGCASGQGLSGGALMSVGAWIFMLSFFAGGYAIAYFVRREWT